MMESEQDKIVRGLMKQDRESPNNRSRIWELFFPPEKEKQLIRTLPQEGDALWRYAVNSQPFTEEQWGETILKSWKYKDGFPTLYHEQDVYDKREVVICLVMSAGMTPEESDRFLDAMSVKEQSYESRRLYPLHVKEGFFRMLMAWANKNQSTISFSEATGWYIRYEEQLYHATMERFMAEERACKESAETGKNPYFYRLCLELAQEMQKWQCPLNPAQQDQLQRMLALLSHLERCICEQKKESSDSKGSDESLDEDAIREQNRKTRKRAGRGTALGLDIISSCACMRSIDEAVDLFLEQAPVLMGEAYWRSISLLMAKYAASGDRMPMNRYIMPRVFSNRNSAAKRFRKVNIFEDDRPDEEQILSFALDGGEVRELVRGASANTVLLASLFEPVERNAEEVLLKPSQDISQTALGFLLRSYSLWCEGKITARSQGIGRFPPPYYNYKRKTMIKFALACGCRSYEDMKTLLELSGSPELNPDSFLENTVHAALQYSARKRISTIEAVFSFQEKYLWRLSRKLCKGIDNQSASQKEISSAARRFRENILYDMVPAKLTDREKEAVYALQILLCMMLHLFGADPEMLSGQNFPDLYGEMDDIEYFQQNYAREIAEEFLDNNHISFQSEQTALVMPLLYELLNRAKQFDFQRAGSASEWLAFFRTWFLVVGMIELSVSDGSAMDSHTLDDTLLSQCKKLLTDQCAYWGFASGCSNFSLSAYEKQYKVNHFERLSPQDKPVYGDRWLREQSDYAKQGDMWASVVSDATVVTSCYGYLCRINPGNEVDYSVMSEAFRKKLEEAAQTAYGISQYLAKGEGSFNLARSYKTWGDELSESRKIFKNRVTAAEIDLTTVR